MNFAGISHMPYGCYMCLLLKLVEYENDILFLPIFDNFHEIEAKTRSTFSVMVLMFIYT